MNLKVSILTVSYQSAVTLRQTIESVLAQDYPNTEYWVIDGGSTDGSLEILKSFGSAIHFISEKDAGIYDAMNKGLKLIHGDVIGMIGADDFYPTNDVISSVVATFESNQVDVVYGDKQYVNPENPHKIVRYWTAGAYQEQQWLYGWMPPHLSFYIKKSSADKNGPYRTDFACSADYEWMLRALYMNKMTAVYLPKVLMTMRNGGTSTASFKHRLIANMEDRKAWSVNHLHPYWFTLALKPLRKIFQLFKSKK